MVDSGITSFEDLPEIFTSNTFLGDPSRWDPDASFFTEKPSETLSLSSTGSELVPKTASNPRYKCTQANCDKDFARPTDRDRHIRTIHDAQDHDAPRFNCSFPGCNRNPDNGGRSFSRQDKLNEHLRNVHRLSGLKSEDGNIIVTSASKTAPTQMKRRVPGSEETSPNPVKNVETNFGKVRPEAIGSKRTLAHEDYSVIWICTSRVEYVASKAFLDEEHEHSTSECQRNDVLCTLGKIRNHNIVIVMMSNCGHSTSYTVPVFQDMLHSFQSIHIALVVGIAGAVPSQQHGIHLGDVVVEAPVQGKEGVLYNDLHVSFDDQKLQSSSFLDRSATALTTAVRELKARYTKEGNCLETTIRRVLKTNPRLGHEFEDLYGTDVPNSIPRQSQAGNLNIHYDYALIASASEPMRDAIARKQISIDQDIICSGTGAEVANRLPCLVVRGICDYVDRRKPGEWQAYAAMTAAAYAKDLLGTIPPNPGGVKRPRLDLLYDLGGASPHVSTVFREPSIARREEVISCRRDLFITDPFEDKEQLNRMIGNRTYGTCEWILGTKEFDAWLNSGLETEGSKGSQLLWLYGNPGTGKSIAASFLAEKLPTVLPTGVRKTVAYFFCSYGFEERRSATSIIRGLLFQLVRQYPRLLGYILPRYEERGPELFKSFETLWAIFINAATDEETGHKYCIVDALDECDRVSQEILLQRLRDLFQGPKSLTGLRILITSRPYPEICYYLEDFTNMDLASSPCMEQDIDRCIEESLIQLTRKKRYTNKVTNDVKDILKDRAEGSFLWLGLACKDLNKIPSHDAVRFLRDIPEGLESLYQRLLDEALGQGETGAKMTRRILGLLAVCLQPVSVLELSEVCQLHPNEEDEETRIQFTRECIAYCRLMVIIRDEKVVLLHQSLRDFLLGPRSRRLIDVFKTHAFLADRCIDILIENFRRWSQLKVSFSVYAVRHWGNHARFANSEFKVKDSQAEFFAVHSPCRELWLNSYRHDTKVSEEVPQKFSLLHLAAKWDVPALTDYVFGSNHHHEVGQFGRLVDCVDASGATPLEYAASLGHTNLVAILLDLGAEVTNRVLCTVAMKSDDIEVMMLLLDRRGDEIVITEDVVKAAAGNAKSGNRVIALLLDRRGDEIAITEDVMKAAAGNVESGKDVTALLLDRRGDEVIITDDVPKATAENVESGEEVMAMLVNRRWSPISAATYTKTESTLNDITAANRPGPWFHHDTTTQ